MDENATLQYTQQNPSDATKPIPMSSAYSSFSIYNSLGHDTVLRATIKQENKIKLNLNCVVCVSCCATGSVATSVYCTRTYTHIVERYFYLLYIVQCA